jgi:hypothetical protein
MQGFAELALELLKAGYHLVFWVEITCPDHGDWRGACAWDGQTLCCPRCQEAVEASLLARGLTKDPTVPWKCVSPALPQGWKTDDRPAAAMQRGERVISRKRCDKFFARARRELAGVG